MLYFDDNSFYFKAWSLSNEERKSHQVHKQILETSTVCVNYNITKNKKNVHKVDAIKCTDV